MKELREIYDKEFSAHLLAVVHKWLDKGKSKLDPKEFRSLYIKKICQDCHAKKKNRHLSANMNQKRVTVINLGQ